MKTCKRCFRKFEESEVDVVNVSPATELADYLDSRFHGNDKEKCGNDKEECGNDRGECENDRGGCGNDRGECGLRISMLFALNIFAPKQNQERIYVILQ